MRGLLQWLWSLSLSSPPDFQRTEPGRQGPAPQRWTGYPLKHFLPASGRQRLHPDIFPDAYKIGPAWPSHRGYRSEEHTSELQSRPHLVCRLLLEKKNTNI